ncbi:MAG: hypothetical protein WCT04_14715 [Planctomycetota bacterium]
MKLLKLTPSELGIFDFGRVINPIVFRSADVKKALFDLSESLGSALVVGGIAVMHHGYVRGANNVNVLYSVADSSILERLSVKFEIKRIAKSGLHSLAHKATGYPLLLLREGTETEFGTIPGPDFFGSENGFIPLPGLIHLKLLRGFCKDEADIVELAVRKMRTIKATRKKLPVEMHGRFDALIVKAKEQIANDPFKG